MKVFLIRLALELLLAATSIDTPIDVEVVVNLSAATLMEQL